jgi:hypothetical protein
VVVAVVASGCGFVPASGDDGGGGGPASGDDGGGARLRLGCLTYTANRRVCPVPWAAGPLYPELSRSVPKPPVPSKEPPESRGAPLSRTPRYSWVGGQTAKNPYRCTGVT